MSWPYTARTDHRATIYIQTGLQTLYIAHLEHCEEQLRSSSNLPKWIECIYLFKWRVHVPKFRNIFLIWPPENQWKCSRSNIYAISFHKMTCFKYKSKCHKWVPSHHTNGSWGKRKKSWLSAPDCALFGELSQKSSLLLPRFGTNRSRSDGAQTTNTSNRASILHTHPPGRGAYREQKVLCE